MTNATAESKKAAKAGSEKVATTEFVKKGAIKWIAEHANYANTIVALVALLISGVVWISNYFATQNQLNIVDRQLRIADCRSIRFNKLARAEVEAKISADEAYRRTIWTRMAEEKRKRREQTATIDQIEKWKQESIDFRQNYNISSEKARLLRESLDNLQCREEIKL